MTNLRALGLVAGLALACNGGQNGTGPTDDDIDTGPTYEPGCISVSDDPFEYAHIDDALAAAPEGATITLCEDLVQTITIDKTITIDADGLLLKPPVNASAVVVVDGGNATIRNALVESTRSGFIVEQGGTLTLQDSELQVIPNYGVDVQRGATATVERVTMNRPQWGGVRVNGGVLTMRDSTIEEPGDYGVYAEFDGTVTLEGNVITEPRLRDQSQTNIFDIGGTGVWLETGASATLRNNQILGPDIVGVSADDSRLLSLDGDVIRGGFAGITVRNTEFVATDTTVELYGAYGVLCVTCADVELNSITIETSPEFSRASTPDLDGSMGFFGIETSVSITGTAEAPSRIAGNNYAGFYLTPRQGGSRAIAEISDTIIDNNGAFGVTIYQGEATLERVEVTNTRNDDLKCMTDTGRACNMAAAFWGANGTLIDSTVADSEDWGLTVVQGVVDVKGSLFARNAFVGAFAQSGTMIFEDTTFAEGRAFGTYFTSNATGIFDRVHFRDAEHQSVFEYTSGDDQMRQVNFYQALDIAVFGSEATITNSTFTNGQRGIQASGSGGTAEVTIVDSTWTDYLNGLVMSFSDSTINISRSTFENIGRYALQVSSGDLRAERITITNATAAPYRLEMYRNGELDWESVSTFAGEPIYGFNGSMRLTDVTVDGADSGGVNLQNVSLLANNLTLTNTARTRNAGGALRLHHTSPNAPSSELINVTVKGVSTGDAVRTSGWITGEGVATPGLISVTNLDIGGPEEADRIAGNGLDASNIGELEIDGLDVQNVGGDGLRFTRTSASVVGEFSRRTGTLTGVAGAGVRIDGSPGGVTPETVRLKDLTIASPGTEGLVALSGAHHLDGVTVTGAGTWGASCSGTGDFETCDATLEGERGEAEGCTCWDGGGDDGGGDDGGRR